MQTRAALLGYSVGLPALILVKILAPGFYARQVMRTPVKIAFFTVLVTQTLAVLLAWPLRLGQAGLTLATSIGACFNAALLFCSCCGATAITCRSPAGRFSSRKSASPSCCWRSSCGCDGRRALWLTRGSCTRSAGSRWVIAAGAIVYFGTLYALGFRLARFQPSRCDRSAGRRSRRRREPYAPDATSGPQFGSPVLRCGQRGFVQSAYRYSACSLISKPRSCATLRLPLLDLGVVELLDAAALHADEMVVVLAFVQLEHRLAGFEMMAHEQARLLELRQHAIDGGKADVETLGQQHPVDVLGGQVPHLRRLEEIDDLEPRHRRLEPRVLQIGEVVMG